MGNNFDAVDLGNNQAAALARLHERLNRVYQSKPESRPVDRAFAWVVRTYGIPKAIPEALLEGYQWDVQDRAYHTLDDLIDYAVRVASSVGVMMALVMGVRERVALARACDLGIAMQLTNIARDIGEDARADRIYLPRNWLREVGVDVRSTHQANEKTKALTKRLLEAADVYYARGEAGTVYLPNSCQAAIVAAARIYRAIGSEIVRNGYDSIGQRAFVSSARKLALLASTQLKPARMIDDVDAPAHPATLFLIEAVQATRQPKLALEDAPSKSVWALEIIGRLEARDRGFNSGSTA